MMSLSALSALVYIALAITIVTPFLMLSLVFLDWKRGDLW